MSDSRPTPEQMLERASEEAARSKQGRLRIFFGAVPGVGKTYAMLEAARARKAQGADVVIGWIETHGRRETAALTEGFERIPPRSVSYRGVQLQEFDLDAALARMPSLIMVDELAHTNAPGSRHARRWQDVVELLDAGVEVWTTLNVQHVESLNDVVSGITGVTVRETVPDSLIDRAEEIELVDLPPDDLLQRLAEGKVYVPAQAERATAHFFKKGNLLALRELALRRTAERVDAQGTEWKREHGIDEVWRTQERILVAIDHVPQAADLLRAARRMASRLRAGWIVLTVEGPSFGRLPEESRERLSEHLALAQRLGAETLVMQGENVAQEILQAARDRNVSRILVGKPRTPRWLRMLRGSVLDDVVRDSGQIEVLVTAGEPEHSTVKPARVPRRTGWEPYAWLFGPILLSTGVCLLTRELFTMVDQAMIHVFGVLVAASRLSRVPALFAAVLSIAAFDFFFVPPTGRFAIADARYGVTFLVMLVVAVTVSSRTVRMREQRDASRERERRNTALFEMSRGFSAELEPIAIATIAVGQVRASFDCDAVVYIQSGASLERLAGDATGVLGSERELAVARWVFENGRVAGFGTDTLPGSQALFVPLRGLAKTVGVLGLAESASGRRVLDDLTPSQFQLLETFAAQTALALERVMLGDEAADARIAAETERLRSSLLSSVSHDLRTPLASITGSAQALLEDQGRLTEADRRELLETVREEGDRLSRLVANLLDLTRIESGVLEVTREWCPVDDVVHSAIGRIERELAGRHVEVDLPGEVPLVPIDPVLVEQALINLLENACKYSPAGTPIDVRVRVEERSAVFEVGDRGRGIPPGEEQRIFEKFYRVGDDVVSKGAGLGLAVVHAIVVAHGGSITAANRPGGGAVFRFSLPIEGEPPRLAEEAR
jgi:two-component system sensor histidine kinase KdpD